MKSPKHVRPREEMRPEYDFSKGVRGKYAKQYAQGSNIIVLDPELTELFPDSRSVNEALRVIARLAKRQSKKAS